MNKNYVFISFLYFLIIFICIF